LYGVGKIGPIRHRLRWPLRVGTSACRLTGKMAVICMIFRGPVRQILKNNYRVYKPPSSDLPDPAADALINAFFPAVDHPYPKPRPKQEARDEKTRVCRFH
jgi:hypothetical protein